MSVRAGAEGRLRLVDALGTIEKQGVADKVVRRILDLVKAGNLKAGDRLPAERELVKIFNVSRPSLREAMRSLSILGVIESHQGGGAFVSNLDAKSLLAPLEFFLGLSQSNVEDVFDSRRLIEVEIVRRAAVRVSDDDLAKLDQMLAAQDEVVDDPIGFRILDSEFHEKLGSLGGSPVLERLTASLYNMGLDVRRRATEMPEVVVRSCEDHRAIVQALRRRDPDAAAAAMTLHLRNIEASTLAVMRGSSRGNVTTTRERRRRP
jgi:GntR family transcriptional regulator, transcriptional repressor for pyruvate dehydrogenase complex